VIYLVMPEDVENADDFNQWAMISVFIHAYPHEEAANEAARQWAKKDAKPYTVRKLAMVSYHRGRR
jgi:hypothetical protein